MNEIQYEEVLVNSEVYSETYSVNYLVKSFAYHHR